MAVEFEFDFDRTLAAMVYIASRKPRSLDTYKMCKLVFLSDKLHLVRFARSITGDTMRAMEYGPVPSHVYDLLKGLIAGEATENTVVRLGEHLMVDDSFAHPRISTSLRSIDFGEYLSRSDLQALDEVIELHGQKSFDELKALTHEMPAWKHAWNDPERTSKNPKMSFEDLFAEDSEALSGAREEMIENFEIRHSVVDVPF